MNDAQWVMVAAALVAFTWFAIGCAVLSFLDDEKQSLFQWARSAPYGLYVPVVMSWPVVMFFWMKGRKQ